MINLSQNKKIYLLIIFIISLIIQGYSFGDAQNINNSINIIQLVPEELHWERNPNLHGLETVTLIGNPNNPEPYAERIKFPAHFRLNPHFHNNQARMVTVISGTLYYAFGEKFDESQLKAFPAGSFFIEPAGLPHYALTKEEVILQLNAIGPATTEYVANHNN